jgi:hypothetical protein
LRFEYDHLDGEFSVYPGHPVTIAYLIMQKYPSLAAASKVSTRSGFGAALSDIDIPGAGGRVHAAMSLLQRRAEGASWEELFARADDIWEGEHFDKHELGQQQADRIKPLLAAARWKETGDALLPQGPT